MDGKKIKKLVIALILVILAGLAYLFLLRYSDKQKEAESQKEQEEAAASVVFETDTDEVSSISFSGDDGILTFEKKNDTWICPDDSVFQMNENPEAACRYFFCELYQRAGRKGGSGAVRTGRTGKYDSDITF